MRLVVRLLKHGLIAVHWSISSLLYYVTGLKMTLFRIGYAVALLLMWKRLLISSNVILTNLVIYMRQVFVLWSNILLKASSGIRVNRMHIIVRHTRNCLSSWLRAGVKTGKMRIYLFIMYSCQVSTVRHGLGSVIASVEWCMKYHIRVWRYRVIWAIHLMCIPNISSR